MATFPSQILEDIQTGKAYLANLVENYQNDMYTGGCTCDLESMFILTSVVRDLVNMSSIGNYDTASQNLYEDMMEIIGGSVFIVTYPTVDAGNDKVAGINIPQTFPAFVSAGSAPITQIIWEQESGTPATLTGTTTATLGVSGFGLGESVFRITVTDSSNNTATDTVRLIGIAQTLSIAYWGSKASSGVLTYSQIISGNPFTYTIGANVTVPLSVPEYLIWWFAIPASESNKNYYQDTVNVLNKGTIGTDQDLIYAPIIVSGIINMDYYEVVYPIPQINPLLVQTI